MKIVQLLTSTVNPTTTSAILQAISSVGFPIVMCIVMFWYIQKVEERHRQEIESLRNAINETKSAINNNTVVMNRVLDKMEG